MIRKLMKQLRRSPSHIVHVFCYAAALVIVILDLHTISGMEAAQLPENCGMSLPLRINYQPGASSSSSPKYPNPTVSLLAVLPLKDQSDILIRLDTRNQTHPVQYISSNRGSTWRSAIWNLGYSNLPMWSRSDRIMSHVDHRVLYDCYYKCKNGFELSKDGGMSWEHIRPTIAGQESINEIEIIETGMHVTGRVYARLWITDLPASRTAVSNDYGQSFELLPEGVTNLVESRAEPMVVYGRVLSNLGLSSSNDGGRTWTAMEASQEFFKPIYQNPVLKYFRSWKEDPGDLECLPPQMIDQIESDPLHSSWIYVLTYKGLYLSRDCGRSFRLSSLARGRLNSVDRIAVDPINGKYLYAAVDLGQFYRSSDYGCSWQEMDVPYTHTK